MKKYPLNIYTFDYKHKSIRNEGNGIITFEKRDHIDDPKLLQYMQLLSEACSILCVSFFSEILKMMPNYV